jgi:hypothetical protein
LTHGIILRGYADQRINETLRRLCAALPATASPDERVTLSCDFMVYVHCVRQHWRVFPANFGVHLSTLKVYRRAFDCKDPSSFAKGIEAITFDEGDPSLVTSWKDPRLQGVTLVGIRPNWFTLQQHDNYIERSVDETSRPIIYDPITF